MSNFAPVSVVVPCFRCAGTIGRAVQSVVEQSHRPEELILVDDASGDGTLAQLESLRARYGPWIRVVACPNNGGAGSARNAGWARATQPYIAFLDSDDAWHPKKIEIQYGYMRRHPDVALSGHLCRQLPQSTQSPPDWQLDAGGEVDVQCIIWRQLLLRHQFVTPSVMVKRDVAPRFTEGTRYMEDHRLWLEIVGASLPTVRLEAELAAVYKAVYGASGLSANMWGMEKAELANYRYFYAAGKLSAAQLFLLQSYSLLKFVRRLLIVRLQGRQ